MNGSRSCLILLLLAACCVTAAARIGEGEGDLMKRYGPPLSSEAVGDYQRSVYEKNGCSITVFFANGRSVMESFTGRGFDQITARKLAVAVASNPSFGCPDAKQETLIRQASGISDSEEVFWTWRCSGALLTAAYNPLECTLTFFSAPAVYAGVHKALADQPL